MTDTAHGNNGNDQTLNIADILDILRNGSKLSPKTFDLFEQQIIELAAIKDTATDFINNNEGNTIGNPVLAYRQLKELCQLQDEDQQQHHQ